MILVFPLLWAAGAAAAYFYAQERGIPWNMVLLALPAFLLEISFYYILGAEKLRGRLEKLHRNGTALALVAAALAPYVLASLALGNFSWHSLAWIAGLAFASAFWYIVFPHETSVDILFLIFVAAVWMSRVVPPLYVTPNAKLPLAVLGQLMWFRTGLLAMLSVRGIPNIGFGFWPRASEWKIGALYFLGFLPVAAAASWATGFAHPHMRYGTLEKNVTVGIATFFGILWVVALGEEFFFRGLLQQWLTRWLGNEWVGLLAASLLFGSVHLWYRSFPNWRILPISVLLGVFCGLAFRQAKSIRASMVTHALTVTAWRIFFS